MQGQPPSDTFHRLDGRTAPEPRFRLDDHGDSPQVFHTADAMKIFAPEPKHFGTSQSPSQLSMAQQMQLHELQRQQQRTHSTPTQPNGAKVPSISSRQTEAHQPTPQHHHQPTPIPQHMSSEHYQQQRPSQRYHAVDFSSQRRPEKRKKRLAPANQMEILRTRRLEGLAAEDDEDDEEDEDDAGYDIKAKRLATDLGRFHLTP